MSNTNVTKSIELKNEETSDLIGKDNNSKKKRKTKHPLDIVLGILSSVKVGVTLLAMVIFATAIGTFIIQKGTSGFREYYQQLMPAERKLYTVLGLLDIYHTWWFNLLLLVVSLNIILASIDYFPAAWRYVKKPIKKVNQSFINKQIWKKSIIVNSLDLQAIRSSCEKLMRPFWAVGIMHYFSSFRLQITENSKDGSTTIFADCGVWNRLTAYAVHISLLTIFTGAFIGGQFGHKGIIRLAPGDTNDTFITQSADPSLPDEQYKMPFQLICTDIQQDLLNPKKPDLSPSNTLDWHTRVIFQHNGKTIPGHIHLNTPFDYRGYRFFQASFDNIGSAREVILQLEATDNSGKKIEVKVGRKVVDVQGIGKLKLVGFYPDFTVTDGQADTVSGDYNKPVAELEWIPETNSTPTQVWAFPLGVVKNLANAPIGTKTLVGTYRIAMTDFEKVSQAHILQVQYDPGVRTVYIGCTMLIACLWLVFFFSHRRLWVLIEPLEDGAYKVSVSGNTNRNRLAFEKRLDVLIDYFAENSKIQEIK